MSNFYFPTHGSLVFITDIKVDINQKEIRFWNRNRFKDIYKIETVLIDKITTFIEINANNLQVRGDHFQFDSPKDLVDDLNTYEDFSWTLSYYIAAIQNIASQANNNLPLQFDHIIITGDIKDSDAWDAGNVNLIKEKIESICEVISEENDRFKANEKAIFIYICADKNVPKEGENKFTRNGKTYHYTVKNGSLEIIRNENDIFKIQLFRVSNNADTPPVKLLLQKLYGSEFLIENQAYIPNNENTNAANIEQAPNRDYIKGLWSFDENDYEIFKNLGRELDKQKCFNLIEKDIFRIGILTGDSGIGKSSFLKAGLIGYCEDNKYKSYYVEVNKENPLLTLRKTLPKKFNLGDPNENPIEDLNEIYNTVARESKVLIIFDQFEQFHLNSNELEKENFLNALIVLSENKTYYKNLKVLLCMRKDLYGVICLDYLEKKEENNLYFTKGKNVFELEHFNKTKALEILKILCLNAKLNFSEESLKKFIENEEITSFVSPIDLQIFVFVAELPDSEITFENLNQNRMEDIYFLYIKHSFKDKDNIETEKLEFRVLTNLIQEGASKPKSMEELKLEIHNPFKIDFGKILESLKFKKLIIQNPQTNHYQLVHEKLIQPIQKMALKILGEEKKIYELLVGRFEAWRRNNKEKKYLLDLVDYFKIRNRYKPSFPITGNKELIEGYIEDSKKRIQNNLRKILLIPSSIFLLSSLIWLGIYGFVISEQGFNLLFKTKINSLINDSLLDTINGKYGRINLISILPNLVYRKIKEGDFEFVEQNILLKIKKANWPDGLLLYAKDEINKGSCYAYSELAVQKKDESFIEKSLEISKNFSQARYREKHKCLIYINLSWLEFYNSTEDVDKKQRYLKRIFENMPEEFPQENTTLANPNPTRILALLNVISVNPSVDYLDNALTLLDNEIKKSKNQNVKFDLILEVVQVLFYSNLVEHKEFFRYLNELKVSFDKIKKLELDYPRYNANAYFPSNVLDRNPKNKYIDDVRKYHEGYGLEFRYFKKYAEVLYLLGKTVEANKLTIELYDLAKKYKVPDGLLMVAELNYSSWVQLEKTKDAFDLSLEIKSKNDKYDKEQVGYFSQSVVFKNEQLLSLFFRTILSGSQLDFQRFEDISKIPNSFEAIYTHLLPFPQNIIIDIHDFKSNSDATGNQCGIGEQEKPYQYVNMHRARINYLHGNGLDGDKIVNQNISCYQLNRSPVDTSLGVLIDNISFSNDSELKLKFKRDIQYPIEHGKNFQGEINNQLWQILTLMYGLTLTSGFSFFENFEALKISNFDSNKFKNYEKLSNALLLNKIFFEDRILRKLNTTYFSERKDSVKKEQFKSFGLLNLTESKGLIRKLVSLRPFNPFYNKLLIDDMYNYNEWLNTERKKNFLKTRMYYQTWLLTERENPLDIPYTYSNYYQNDGSVTYAEQKLGIELDQIGRKIFAPSYYLP